MDESIDPEFDVRNGADRALSLPGVSAVGSARGHASIAVGVSRNEKRKVMSENTTTLTDSNFDESVLKSSVPVLVDFWAEWCGPCRMIAPTVEALASDYNGRVTIGKLNVDDNPNTAMQFGVRSIPTLLLFKNGEVVESVVGLTDKARLGALIDKHLSAAPQADERLPSAG